MAIASSIIGALTAIASGTAKGVKAKKDKEAAAEEEAFAQQEANNEALAGGPGVGAIQGGSIAGGTQPNLGQTGGPAPVGPPPQAPQQPQVTPGSVGMQPGGAAMTDEEWDGFSRY